MHADEVVSVHNGVDEAVEEDSEENVTVVVDVGVKPVEEENGRMVVNMKERELTPLFTNHNENGVPEVPNLSFVHQSYGTNHSELRC